MKATMKTAMVAMLAMVCMATVGSAREIPVAAMYRLRAGGDWRDDEVRRVISYIQAEISRQGLMQFVERREIEQVLIEIGEARGGLVRDEDFIKFGQQYGAKYVIVGELSDPLFHERDVRSPAGGGKVLGKIVDVSMTVTIRVIDSVTALTPCEIVERISNRFEMNTHERIDRDRIKDDMAHAVARRVATEMGKHPMFRETQAPKEQAALVGIRIESVPEGADVSINGVFYGNAPGTFKVSPGNQAILVELEGYTPWERQVNCAEGMNFTARLREIRQPDVVVHDKTDITIRKE
jgi:hypothetical protein